jgi:DNA polymerase III alpha subunit
MVPFAHLHVHSNFSFLDGASRVDELVARAAELGQPALALTDHNGLYGAVRFAKACAKAGIKPIFGAEVLVQSLAPALAAATVAKAVATPELPRDKQPSQDPHHLILLAESRDGYANLCRLISAAQLADPERQKPPLVMGAVSGASFGSISPRQVSCAATGVPGSAGNAIVSRTNAASATTSGRHA